MQQLLFLTSDAKAAVTELPLDVHLHVQVELFQRPVVGLSHILPGGRDVSLRGKQTPQPDIDSLCEGGVCIYRRVEWRNTPFRL